MCGQSFFWDEDSCTGQRIGLDDLQGKILQYTKKFGIWISFPLQVIELFLISNP